MSQRSQRVRTGVGIGLLVAAFALSTAQVLRNQATYEDPGKKVIRLCHWQLEPGYREALDQIIAGYEKRHPDVKVIQIPIPESGYVQWVNTQLLGGTAPDLIELRISEELDVYLARFFYPTTEDIDEPNPYNAGNDLAQVPWRDTFFDAMVSSYRERLLDYYGIPNTFHTVRLYYNRDMFREILGSDRAPETYRELIDLCDTIRTYARRHDLPLYPMAGSRYQTNMLRGRYFISMTAGLLDLVDQNYNGLHEPFESYLAFAEKKLSLVDPKMKAGHEITRKLAGYFQPGFMAANREDGVFMFVQGRAAMISTGSWDSQSLMVSAPFEVGVFRFPYPTRDDPDFGRYFDGPYTEAGIGSGGLYGVTRLSRHKEVALDFMRYWTCREVNERFNRRAHWLPCIRGARPLPELEPFMPELDGYDYAVYAVYGSAGTVYRQHYWPYVSGRIDYETLMERSEPAYKEMSWRDYEEFLRNQHRKMAHQERMLSLFRVNRLLRQAGAPGPQARARKKFLSVMETQVLLGAQVHRLENDWARLKKTSWIFK